MAGTSLTLNPQQISAVLNQFGVPAIGTVDATLTLDTSDSLYDLNYAAQLAATTAALGGNKTLGWAAANLAASGTALDTGAVVLQVDYTKYKQDLANNVSGVALLHDEGVVVADGFTVAGDIINVAGATISQFNPEAGEVVSGIGNYFVIGGVAANHLDSIRALTV